METNRTMEIYCCKCQSKVEARLTNGGEIYPHREDLKELPFWKHDKCGGHVGCHHKTKNRTQPLGCIPSAEIKTARVYIHKVLDPLWQHGKYKRNEIYKMLSKHLGWRYHTAQIRTIEEARDVYRFLKKL